MFQTDDMIEQHNILNEVSKLIDNGTIKTTLGENFGTINAENMRKAHAFLETGKLKVNCFGRILDSMSQIIYKENEKYT